MENGKEVPTTVLDLDAAAPPPPSSSSSNPMDIVRSAAAKKAKTDNSSIDKAWVERGYADGSFAHTMPSGKESCQPHQKAECRLPPLLFTRPRGRPVCFACTPCA